MIIDEEEHLKHYGILRRSGRYPWGSGGPESNTGPRVFLDYVASLRGQGLSETEIARGMGTTVTDLRNAKSIANNEKKQADIAMAQRLKDKGYGNSEIGRRMSLPESSVRALLAPGQKDKADILEATKSMLKDQVDKKKYVDVGAGAELYTSVTRDKLNTAIAALRDEGYTFHYVKTPQLGTGLDTTMKVLAAPGVTGFEVFKNKEHIKQITDFSDDGGRSWLGLKPPLNVATNRVAVRYAKDGGAEADGVIYVRPGVSDLSLGASRYAQVRIAVGGTHYLKGMAMYKDDLPPGIDLLFNTNKSNTGNTLDALKPLKDEPDNPFGAIVRQKIDPVTKKNTSAMNIVNEEGDWDRWSRSISSQTLSKQSPHLAQQQLDMTYSRKKSELDEIMALTNPSIRKKLLESFADDADSSAVHMKAAPLPNSSWHVILPFSSVKDNEIYAPNFPDGQSVALVRYPHAGTFEIPILTVNNNNRSAKAAIGRATDAVGINSKVAHHLSGADFDGDAVLVIPNDKGQIKTASPLAGLKDFDPQIYKIPEGSAIPKISSSTKQHEMGNVTNLIADMTIRKANSTELAAAVRHSMVVIDAEKHNLNYKQSARDNGIAHLKTKYQGSARSGASTLITRAGASVRVPERTPRSASKGGPIDPATGKKVFEPTGTVYTNKAGKIVPKTQKSKKLAEVDDANLLSSGTVVEKVYATHSNKLKDLANEARRQAVHTNENKRSESAALAYHKQVQTLDAKLRIANRNAPLERQAQILANGVVSAKRKANPTMAKADLKKIESQALTEMRARTGAKKQRIVIDDDEWAAIQAGAVSPHKLNQIIRHSDLDRLKHLATPHTKLLMDSSKIARAASMLNSGYTQAEVAAALGVSLTTLKSSFTST
jgi:hypothetical protein